jgi:1,4-dihydroxy-2-naphthoate octaprenyltransferase
MRDILSHGRVLMALLAGSMTAAAQAVLHLPHTWRPFLIASLGTFVIYNLNHLWDGREDEINTPGRRVWRARSASLWRGMMILATVSGLILAVSGGQAVLILTLFLVAVGLAYSIPWPMPAEAKKQPASESLSTPYSSSLLTRVGIFKSSRFGKQDLPSPPAPLPQAGEGSRPKPSPLRGEGRVRGDQTPSASHSQEYLPLYGGFVRLKGKLGLNLALIGVGWALMGVGLPLAEARASLTLQAVLMALWLMGISGILATAFDLRDLLGDASEGLGTLAVLLGPIKARRFLMGWCALSAATIVGAVALGFFPSKVLIATFAPGVAYIWVARWPSDSLAARGHADGLLLAEIAASWLTMLVLRVSV